MQTHPPVTPERINQLAWGFAPPLAMEAAIKHRVFDELDGGPKTLAEMVSATGASARGLRALMNMLVGLNLLAKADGDCYTLTPESAAFLVSTKPSFQGGLLRHTSTQIIPGFLHLSDVVSTGKPHVAVNTEAPGSAFFQDLVSDLFPMNFPAARALGQHLAFGDSGPQVSVLDIAAGSGVWGIGLAQSSPRVQVTAVDWEGVLPVTERTVARFGVTDRYTFVPGDLETADFGHGHQVATLGHILHSEGEARSRKLLQKVADALAPGGTIAIAEFLVNSDRTGPPGPLIFAVNMLLHTELGDTYSFEQIAAWLTEAGFTNPRLLEAPAPSPLLLATKQ